jgi:protein involved in polysaccharide export with SLBB domain
MALQSNTMFGKQLYNIISSLIIILLLAGIGYSQTTAKTDEPENAYRIKKGDKLSVKFLYHPELNEPSIVVRPDGLISLQLIEDVKAEGLTATELKKLLDKSYNEILINPVISVNIVEFLPPSVFIGGQVSKPGKYDLREGNTLVKVIFLAGGFTRDANRKMVLYARSNGDNKWSVQQINVMKLLEKLSEQKDISLQDGDYIFIPDSKMSQFNKAMEGFQALFPILRFL